MLVMFFSGLLFLIFSVLVIAGTNSKERLITSLSLMQYRLLLVGMVCMCGERLPRVKFVQRHWEGWSCLDVERPMSSSSYGTSYS